MASEKPKPAEELRVLLSQEMRRWADSNEDAHAIRMMLYGFAHIYAGHSQPFWSDALVIIGKLEQLAIRCARNETVLQECVASLGAEQPDGTRAEALH